jgi:acyl dehydratase
VPGFARPVEDRYFEDYLPGIIVEFGAAVVEEAEVIDFARRYDPQPMHTDPAWAASGPFGGLIASGWHTAGLMMRMYTEYYLSTVASMVSPGLDELRWVKPVRPGDVLRVRARILEARRSRTKPDRGVVRTAVEVINAHDDVVMTNVAINLFRCRDAAPRTDEKAVSTSDQDKAG